MNKLALFIAILALGIAGSLGFSREEPTAGAFNPTGGGTYTLQSSISSTQTTITLTSFTEPMSNIPYTMSYLNSSIEYGTIAPSSGTSEFISFTGITQNANGTAQLTGVTRGLARTPGSTGCVASTTLARAYPGQTQFILGNSPCFYSQYAVKQNNEAIQGVWSFDQYPVASSTLGYATTSYQLITLAQASAMTVQGAATSTESIAGISRLATALQAASSTDLGANIPLVLQAKNATDTPRRGCSTGYTSTAGAGCGVIAQLTGKISQAWLNLTEHFTFTSLFATSASSTNATTTNLSVTSGRIFSNGVMQSWPSSQGSASTTPYNDGSGNITWVNPEWKLLTSTTTSATATTATTSSFTAATHLRVIIYTPSTSASNQPVIRFNGDYSTNYGYASSDNGGAATQASGATHIIVGVSTTSPSYTVVDILNQPTVRKFVNSQSTANATGASAPSTNEASGVWNNTSAAITQISVSPADLAQSFGSGVKVWVYGTNY